MVPFSVLDLSPITEGSDAGQALRNSLDLARHVEALGYRRYWMAEHHNLPGIASAATAVALAHVAAGTGRIRIGAGGIMLPNHAPLMIAEQFGTLAALHPGRVELGLGRAPGLGPGHRAGGTPRLARRRGELPAGSGRADGLFRPPSRAKRSSRARRRAQGADLDPRLQHVRRAARGLSRPAVRLRLAFRAGDDEPRSRSTAPASARRRSSTRLM